MGRGALLAVLPDPVVCYAGARYQQLTQIDLDDDASLVLVEALSSGRSARGERWDFARYAARTTIARDGRAVATEATVLDPSHGALRTRMGRFDALATAFAFGPRAAEVREALLQAGRRPLERRADVVLAASPLGDSGAVLRVAGTSPEAVTRALHAALAPLASALGDDPFARKW